MVLYLDFLFVNQRVLNLINRRHGTQIIYMELRGLVENWIMRSCLLSFTTQKVMNAEVFAKGLEMCRMLTTFLGQNKENLDDYGWPKIQELRTNSSWICSSYLSDTIQVFTVPRGKQSCMENGLCNVCKFCIVSCIVVIYPINHLKFFKLSF